MVSPPRLACPTAASPRRPPPPPPPPAVPYPFHPCSSFPLAVQAAALDYVKAPTSQFGMPDSGKGGAKDKAAEHKLSKKLKVRMRRGKRRGSAVARRPCRSVHVCAPIHAACIRLYALLRHVAVYERTCT